MQAIPMTVPTANEVVERLHRHHARLPMGFAWWCVGAVKDGDVVGVAMAGRPTNRNNDDGQTVEVLRVATDGTKNAPSFLLGCCARAARAIGARRIITYTLEDEGGGSLRAAGWVREKDNITSWWTHTGTRAAAIDRPHMKQRKVRWARHFHDGVDLSGGFGQLDEVVTATHPYQHVLELYERSMEKG